jgi:hypothetical protein
MGRCSESCTGMFDSLILGTQVTGARSLQPEFDHGTTTDRPMRFS